MPARPMRFDILTIFPGMFDCYLDESMIKRARARKLLDIRVHDIRRWTKDAHKTVDDRPFGGGPGMVLKIEPIHKALKSIRADKSRKSGVPAGGWSASGGSGQQSGARPYVILLSPRGKRFDQRAAERLSKRRRLVLICGRYEGVDQRVSDHLVDEEISIGDYILTGGELPAMVILDAVGRLVPGVVGKEASVQEESHMKEGYIEYPHYTRPEVYKTGKETWKVPKVLLSGDHKKIRAWREKKSAVRGQRSGARETQ